MRGVRILFSLLALALTSAAADLPAVTINRQAASADHFVGWQSCGTSGCHGGGKGSDQVLIWKKDPHSRSNGILISERSMRMAEALGIKEPATSAQCTQCHSPMQSASPELVSSKLKHANIGVSCETCHGPAEGWLRFHTREDITHGQRVAAGLRDLDSTYQKANSCVGCHGNLPETLHNAGHPTLRFELARQIAELPPHWQGYEPSQSASAWVTSQAVLLRELCWLAEKGQPQPERIAALQWILRETSLGAEHLSADSAPSTIRPSADRLAKAASRQHWTEKQTRGQLVKLLALGNQVGEATGAAAFAKAETLTPALHAMVLGLGGKDAEKAKSPLSSLDLAIRAAAIFDPKRYAQAVEELAKAVQ